MADDHPSSLSRVGSVRYRPNHAPMGPRTRNRQTTQDDTHSTTSTTSNITINSPPPPATNGLPSPITTPSSSRPSSKALAAIAESEPQPDLAPAPPYVETDHAMSLSRAHSRVSRPIPKPPPPPIQLPKLVPPPTINFDTPPIEWKSLPLEAALCVFP